MVLDDIIEKLERNDRKRKRRKRKSKGGGTRGRKGDRDTAGAALEGAAKAVRRRGE